MKTFSSKLKGDIAEYKVISELLLKGAEVLTPLGDRLKYDLAIVNAGKLFRIQVKMAWVYSPGTYLVDIRRSQTNRTHFKHTKYQKNDFDFLIAWLPEINVFYIIPSHIACSYAGAITMVEAEKRQRKPRSAKYRNALYLLFQ